MDWIAAIIIIAGVVLQIRKNRYSFIVFMVAGVMWIVVGVQDGRWGMVSVNCLLLLLEGYGFFKWSEPVSGGIPDRDVKWIEFDLDGILAVEQEKITCSDDHMNAIPVSFGVRLVEHFKKEGYKIRIHTARWEEDYDITAQWLRVHNIPYDQLVVGKMPYLLKIDDRTWNPRQMHLQKGLYEKFGLNKFAVEKDVEREYEELIIKHGGK